MNILLSGTGVALVTPFNDGSVDHENLKQLVDHVIDGEVDFIVALGTTGEAPTLSLDERRAVYDTILRHTDGRVPVVAGSFGGNNTAAITQHLRDFNFDGFAAIMSSSPSYSRPSQEGIYQHYTALAEAAPLPILIYNVPARTGSNVEPETALRLAEAGPEIFCGIKEAAGDLDQADELLRHRPPDFSVLCGDDPLALSMLAHGADGAVSVIANALPEVFSELVRTAREDDLTSARDFHGQLAAIHPWLYVEGNPVGLKVMMELLDLCSSEVRLPLVPMSAEGRAGLVRVVRDALMVGF